MATAAQITANRANAQRSTGPQTAEGKSAARFNALKHGLDAASAIIPGEDPAEFDTLAAEYRAEFRPRSPSEIFHVDTMLRADWQKRRLQRAEADLYRTVLAEAGTDNVVTAILSDTPAAKLLTRVQRQIVAFERAWYRANTELTRARRAHETAEAEAFDAFVERTCPIIPIPELASFPSNAGLPACKSERSSDTAVNPALRL